MNLFRKALESVEEEKTVVMKGPLADIYTQALNIVYAKDDPNTDQQTDDGGEVGLESASDKKVPKKKPDVKKGAFHKWLGKKPGDPITESDIHKGLSSSDPEVKKMAVFAKNAKKWQDSKKKKGNVAKESFDILSFNNELALETQQMDVAMFQKLAASLDNTPPIDNYITIYGTSKDQVDEDDVVNVTAELAKTAQDKSDGKDVEFILVVDAVNNTDHDGDHKPISEKMIDLNKALECMVLCNGGKVYSSLEEFYKKRK